MICSDSCPTLNYIDWPWYDSEFAETLGADFDKRLSRLETDPSIKDIWAITHVPTFIETVTRRPENIAWQIGSAYFYNLTLGKRLRTSPKLRRVVSGHTHIGIDTQIRSYVESIGVQVIAADYGAPKYLLLEYS